MKRVLYIVMPFLLGSFLFVSCEKDDDFFDESLLIGKWVSGTEYYKYLNDGTGSTWDTGDDVSEDEAQAFTWTLEKSELIHIHIMEIGGSVPKVYTVTELTATTLKYEDGFGKKFSYTKVND